MEEINLSPFTFSIYAMFQGKFVEALFIYPLLVIAYVFARRGRKGEE
ncbi:MAG: hypothetical protein IH612_08975 [Desulfofustis sp.]|nr:hypothetical protein [Desulfofustis sp.]